MNTLSRSIMWDRYSMKVKTRAPRVHDQVIATVEGRRLPAEVVSIEDNKYEVSTEYGDHGYVDLVDIDIIKETKPEDIWLRIARNASDNDDQKNDFYSILRDWKFVPAGRILANLGTGTNESYYNCFVLPSPKDSRDGIFLLHLCCAGPEDHHGKDFWIYEV